MLKTDLINSFHLVNKSIKNHFQILPMDKLDFTIHPKSMTMEKLIRHLQSIELFTTRGVVSNIWEKNVQTDVSTRESMIQTLDNNHNQAIKLLEQVDENDLVNKHIKTPFSEGSMLSMLLFNLDHLHHHRTQLFLYLKLLDLDVNTMTIWG